MNVEEREFFTKIKQAAFSNPFGEERKNVDQPTKPLPKRPGLTVAPLKTYGNETVGPVRIRE